MDSNDSKETTAVGPIEGLTPIEAIALADFKRAMTDEVIPEIVRVVEERRMQAAESRHWQLKC